MRMGKYMTHAIGVKGINAVKTGRIFMMIMLSILLTASCIPSELPIRVFDKVEAASEAYTAPGTTITGRSFYNMTGGCTVEAFNTVAAKIADGSPGLFPVELRLSRDIRRQV